MDFGEFKLFEARCKKWNWICWRFHGLKMTRALADGATHDHWLKYHRFFKGCKDYDESDIKRGSSRIGVGSTVLVHISYPVDSCGNPMQGWTDFDRILKFFRQIRTHKWCVVEMMDVIGETSVWTNSLSGRRLWLCRVQPSRFVSKNSSKWTEVLLSSYSRSRSEFGLEWIINWGP